MPFGTTVTQVDVKGTPLTALPQALDFAGNPDIRFPASLPVHAFDAGKYVSPWGSTGDIVHRFYEEQSQIDGGKMDGFMAWSDNPGLLFSNFNATDMPEGQLAAQYTLADNGFHSAFGGSFFNHQFLICACAPMFPNGPAAKTSVLAPGSTTVLAVNATGGYVNDGFLTPDGYVINTAYTVNTPHPAGYNPSYLVPQQTEPDDRRSPDRPERLVEMVFGRLGPRRLPGIRLQTSSSTTSPSRTIRATPTAPPPRRRTFRMRPLPCRRRKQNMQQRRRSSNRSAKITNTRATRPCCKVNARRRDRPGDPGQPLLEDTAIIITYDENGGRWDHVAPPVIDRWGPGTRVPFIMISPFASTASSITPSMRPFRS